MFFPTMPFARQMRSVNKAMPSRFVLSTLAAAGLLGLGLPAVAQNAAKLAQPAARLSGAIDDSARTTLPGTHSPRANAALDAGALAGGTRLEGMTLVFSRTDAQQAALGQLLADLQDRSSAHFHQWLTPAQFAARFGVADSDLAKTEAWLSGQGFQVTGVSNARDRISFTGTAAQVAQAFGAPLHNYTDAAGATHFAPSADFTVPAALAGVVRTVGNVSSFRPRPHVRVKPAVSARFTSAQTGSHFLTPKDLGVIYDINAAYNSGYDGTGVTIAVVGQSSVSTTDITNFQTAAGVPVRAPSLILMPGTGTATVSTGDEGESDLDLEYTSGVARGANIKFVYTGSNTNYGAFDALAYAIDNNLAPIISVSYGDCETDLGAANFVQLNAILAQAAAQGQTIIAAAGDNGSTDCYEDTTMALASRQALAVDFPSDSENVTGMGGSMFTAAAVASGSSYWQTASGSDVLTSAVSYMPEQVWNNDSTSGLSSGGGGISVLNARPSWQTGVPGIAAGSFRLTPDISLAASPDNAGYLYCSSDTKSTGITGSCANGFRDSSSQYLTVAGGTSFAAPVFAGMLAIVSQKLNATTGLGNINPTLYRLAANPSTYASAFHDITTGTNGCSSGTTVCTTTGAGSFAATTGYDTASGLGSIDLYNLLSAWPNGSSAGNSPAASFAVTGTAASITSGATGTSTITVTPANGYTGTVAYTITPNTTLANVCYTLPSSTVSSTAAALSTLTIYTSAAACQANTNAIALGKIGSTTTSASVESKGSGTASLRGEVLEAATLLGMVTFFGFRRRKQTAKSLRPLFALGLLGILGFTATGCGGNTTPSAASTTTTTTTSSTNATKGTYTLTITGTDTTAHTLTSTTAVTLTIQ